MTIKVHFFMIQIVLSALIEQVAAWRDFIA
jgi:hypothetical protein